MIQLERALLTFDLEATGPEPTKDRIVQIGVVVLHPDGTRKRWDSLVNPGIPIPPEVTEIHGITDAMVAGAPPFSAIASQVHRGLAGKDLAGYNLRRFDLIMLDEELRRCGFKLDLTGVRVIDADVLYKKKHPRTLPDFIKEYCGREHVDAHGALPDAEGTADGILAAIQRHEDLRAMSLAELEAFTTHGDVRYADLCGKLVVDPEGYVVYNFGKSKGVRVVDDPGFGDWMMGKDFAGSTIDALKAEMRKQFPV